MHEFLECFENLFLLAKKLSFVKVAQHDCEEKIEQDDAANDEKEDEVNGGDAACAPDRLDHDVAPARAHDHDEEGENCLAEGVKVLTRGRAILYIYVSVVIELDFASVEAHAD